MYAIPMKLIVNANLAIFPLFSIYFVVAKSIWNFIQGTTVQYFKIVGSWNGWYGKTSFRHMGRGRKSYMLLIDYSLVGDTIPVA